jgi:Leucine rich repeat
MDAKPKRRSLRYSLRTLLVFLTIACAGFGWLGMKVRAKQRESEAVKAITTQRVAFVQYDYQLDANWRPISSATPPGPDWLRKRLGDECFAEVVMARFYVADPEEFPDSNLSHLKLFPSLKVLDLSGTDFPDAELAHLEGLNQLEWLKLSNTGYSDAALVHLRGLTQLKELYISRTQITDAGLVNLQGLTNLKMLTVSLNRITDAGLAHLRGLPELKELDVGGTQVTDESCQELQKALPKLKIVRW